jgi:putative flippase GtrA
VTGEVSTPNGVPAQATFARYVIVGLVTLVIYLFAVRSLLAAALPPSVSAGVAVAIAGVANFWLHRTFTFKGVRPVLSSVRRYVALLAANSLICAAIVDLLVSQFGLPPLIVSAAAAFLSAALIYLVLKHLVM